ncbi:MAG: metalloprotease TldD, partial [Chromatiaceae bacterium]
MSNIAMLNAVEQNLIAASDLTDQDVAHSLSFLFAHQLDYADLYFQSSVHESWVLEDGLVK